MIKLFKNLFLSKILKLNEMHGHMDKKKYHQNKKLQDKNYLK